MIKLPKVVAKSKKRVGRGMGSGKGSHTSGRGQKGQKSRSDLHILFEGLKMKKSFLKRLPLTRGKGKFHSRITHRKKLAAFKLKTSSKNTKAAKV